MSDVQYEIRFSCTDIECGHTFVATLTAVRTLKASTKPNANVHLPLSTSLMREAKKRQRAAGSGSADKVVSRNDLKFLDGAQINKIRELKAQGVSSADLGKRYSISQSHVNKVLK